MLPQVWSYGDRRRAENLARQVRGSRVSGPRRRGCLRGCAVLVALAVIAVGLLIVFGGLVTAR